MSSCLVTSHDLKKFAFHDTGREDHHVPGWNRRRKRIDTGLILKAFGEKYANSAFIVQFLEFGRMGFAPGFLWKGALSKSANCPNSTGDARCQHSVHEDISVAPGDHVDVLIIGEGKESSTVLRNVEVVAEDQKVGVVEFFVSPDDAQRVTQASERGQFSLRLWKSD